MECTKKDLTLICSFVHVRHRLAKRDRHRHRDHDLFQRLCIFAQKKNLNNLLYLQIGLVLIDMFYATFQSVLRFVLYSVL